MGEIIIKGSAFWAMVVVFAFSFIIKGIECKYYEKMLEETLDLHHTAMLIFKQMKMRFESMCRIGKNVYSTRNFVDKSMQTWKICGIKYDVLRRVDEMLGWTCIYIGLAFAMFVYFKDGITGQMVLYVGGGLLMWIGLKMWDITLAIQQKFEKIIIFTADYLENMAANINQNVVTPSKNVAVEKKEKKETVIKSSQKKENKYDEKVIEDVLKEFLA